MVKTPIRPIYLDRSIPSLHTICDLMVTHQCTLYQRDTSDRKASFCRMCALGPDQKINCTYCQICYIIISCILLYIFWGRLNIHIIHTSPSLCALQIIRVTDFVFSSLAWDIAFIHVYRTDFHSIFLIFWTIFVNNIHILCRARLFNRSLILPKLVA